MTAIYQESLASSFHFASTLFPSETFRDLYTCHVIPVTQAEPTNSVNALQSTAKSQISNPHISPKWGSIPPKQRRRSNPHISLKSHTSAFSNSYRRLTRPSGFIRSLLNTSAKCNNPFSRNRCDAAVGRYDKQMR